MLVERVPEERDELALLELVERVVLTEPEALVERVVVALVERVVEPVERVVLAELVERPEPERLVPDERVAVADEERVAVADVERAVLADVRAAAASLRAAPAEREDAERAAAVCVLP